MRISPELHREISLHAAETYFVQKKLAYLQIFGHTMYGLGDSSLGHRRREEFPATFFILNEGTA